MRERERERTREGGEEERQRRREREKLQMRALILLPLQDLKHKTQILCTPVLCIKRDSVMGCGVSPGPGLLTEQEGDNSNRSGNTCLRPHLQPQGLLEG